MKKKPIIINICGKSNTGKSTLVNELLSKMTETYTVSYDRSKRQLAGYHRGNHKKLIQDITLGFFEVVCKQNLSIIVDGFISTKKRYQTYINIAEKYGYRFISINLKASPEVVLERFRERTKEYKAKGVKVFVMDESLFLENQLIDYFIPPDTKVFDTSEMMVNEIADQVMQEIEK